MSTPLRALGQFIKAPGKPPGEESLRIYVNRLREGGFVITNLLSKLQQCGLLVGELASLVGPKQGGTVAIKGDAEAAEAAAKQAQLISEKGRRCGECQSCKQRGGSRRCLKLRCAAAAAAGHAGAQVALLKEAAIGKRLAVWWSGDEAFYTGNITAFDPFRWSHKIAYDDSDVEVTALWAPHEMVELISTAKAAKTSSNGKGGAKRRRLVSETEAGK